MQAGVQLIDDQRQPALQDLQHGSGEKKQSSRAAGFVQQIKYRPTVLSHMGEP